MLSFVLFRTMLWLQLSRNKWLACLVGSCTGTDQHSFTWNASSAKAGFSSEPNLGGGLEFSVIGFCTTQNLVSSVTSWWLDAALYWRGHGHKPWKRQVVAFLESRWSSICKADAASTAYQKLVQQFPVKLSMKWWSAQANSIRLPIHSNWKQRPPMKRAVKYTDDSAELLNFGSGSEGPAGSRLCSR